jgi:hypothetical protein
LRVLLGAASVCQYVSFLPKFQKGDSIAIFQGGTCDNPKITHSAHLRKFR